MSCLGGGFGDKRLEALNTHSGQPLSISLEPPINVLVAYTLQMASARTQHSSHHSNPPPGLNGHSSSSQPKSHAVAGVQDAYWSDEEDKVSQTLTQS